MKRMLSIGILLIVLLSACTPKGDENMTEMGKGVSSSIAVSPKLSAIDSLMWQRPDSALTLLLPYFDTISTTYNRHYAHLLLAELLYKNDYSQTNRAELLQAMDYFDSLCCRDVSGNVSTIAFLDARAHYINGVGYYEQDSMVQACAEYLRALETMEGQFDEKHLIGKKAKFMVYIHNRLGDLFETLLLAEPAITCYKQALFYCSREPTSKYGIPVLLYRLGIQFNIIGQKDSTVYYYDEALANMPDFDNIHYRDIMVNKIVFAYFNLDYSSDSIINDLKRLVALSSDENEKLTRLSTLGNILFEDKQYDSSIVYLETVFEQQEDVISRIMAAENLNSIYQMKGDSIKAQKYASFLSGFTIPEIEKKIDVSKVNEMFKDYMTKKQERQAKIEQEKAIKKAIGIVIPISVVVALAILVLAKRRSKKLLKQQQEEADKKLGETEQQHRMQQAALSGRLKKSNEELRDVSMQLEQTLAKTPSESMPHDDYASYVNTAICQYIIGVVHEQQFKSKMDYLIYKDSALSKDQLLSLRDAAEKHLNRFVSQIRKRFSRLTESDMDYCYLFLLGLSEADVSALMQRAYTTVCDRSRKISRILDAEGRLYHTLRSCLSEQ